MKSDPNTLMASLGIVRDSDGVLSEVKIIMPVWINSNHEENFSLVNAPLLGIELFVFNDIDIDSSIQDAAKCFIELSERIGKGVEKEIESIGWRSTDTEHINHNETYNYSSSDPIMPMLMNMGQTSALVLSSK